MHIDIQLFPNQMLPAVINQIKVVLCILGGIGKGVANQQVTHFGSSYSAV